MSDGLIESMPPVGETIVMPIGFRLERIKRDEDGSTVGCLLKFVTPYHIYTMKFNDEDELKEALRPLYGGIIPATLREVPPGA